MAIIKEVYFDLHSDSFHRLCSHIVWWWAIKIHSKNKSEKFCRRLRIFHFRKRKKWEENKNKRLFWMNFILFSFPSSQEGKHVKFICKNCMCAYTLITAHFTPLQALFQELFYSFRRKKHALLRKKSVPWSSSMCLTSFVRFRRKDKILSLRNVP